MNNRIPSQILKRMATKCTHGKQQQQQQQQRPKTKITKTRAKLFAKFTVVANNHAIRLSILVLCMQGENGVIEQQ